MLLKKGIVMGKHFVVASGAHQERDDDGKSKDGTLHFSGSKERSASDRSGRVFPRRGLSRNIWWRVQGVCSSDEYFTSKHSLNSGFACRSARSLLLHTPRRALLNEPDGSIARAASETPGTPSST